MYSSINTDLKDLVDKHGEITVNCKLDELLKERGLSQKEFSKMSGLRENIISEFKNLKKHNINLGTLVIIMCVLGITDITDILEIEFVLRNLHHAV